jgi:hypothetical protein
MLSFAVLLSQMKNAYVHINPAPPLHHRSISSLTISQLKTELAQWSQQMGAIHRYDLTLDVTHLIVGDYNTPKYRYVAKQRPDVRSMTIGWIDALRELWIQDREIDLEALERQHLLPTFASLKFSMTGCDDRMKYKPLPCLTTC